MSIRDWPAGERPREKLLQNGAASLSDAELLAIFLRTGVAGCSALALARQLLSAFGGLRALLDAGLAEFCQHKGLGPAKFAQLQAVLELSRRHLAEDLQRRTVLEAPEQVRRYLRAQLRDKQNETFAVVFLDSQQRVIAYEELFQGTINATQVHGRRLVQRALAHNCAAVILAHNHPSGLAEPSRADELLTQQLSAALRLIDVRVLDHCIVGDDTVMSFVERGLL